jgi:hypothetical protein
LFFIPIFPSDNEKLYFCPICKHGFTLDNEFFNYYKSIADINTAYSEKRINEKEQKTQLDAINSLIAKSNEAKRFKYTEESKNWVKLASEKSNYELMAIINSKIGEYNPAFVIAVEAEIEKRKSNNKQ